MGAHGSSLLDPLVDHRNFPYTTANNASGSRSTKMDRVMEEMSAKVSIDYSNREMKDIQTAVRRMLQKIVSRVNERGVFKISRLEPCGSMVEQTSVWKYISYKDMRYTEFDNLAVLGDQPEVVSNPDCEVCIPIKKLPADFQVALDRELFVHKSMISILKGLNNRQSCDRLFWLELNGCLVSSCDCFVVEFASLPWVRAKFKKTPHHNVGCDKCTVEMPTGILTVSTSLPITNHYKKKNRQRCSLLFSWSSKAKELFAYDKSLQQESQPINELLIMVDLLPALELFKPTPSGNVHDYFLVPKSCGKCCGVSGWRKSRCMTEIAYTVNEMTDKHKKCYRIIKYIFSIVFSRLDWAWYELKIMVLNHSRHCSDTSDGCAACVQNILAEIKHSYETKTIIPFHTDLNIFSVYSDHKKRLNIIEIYIQRLTDCKFFIPTDTNHRLMKMLSTPMPSEEHSDSSSKHDDDTSSDCFL